MSGQPAVFTQSNRVWLAALAAELQGLGYPADVAERTARAVLVRVVTAAGWKPEGYEVAGTEELPPDE